MIVWRPATTQSTFIPGEWCRWPPATSPQGWSQIRWATAACMSARVRTEAGAAPGAGWGGSDTGAAPEFRLPRAKGGRGSGRGIRAPSTLGSFLPAFDHGNVRRLAEVHPPGTDRAGRPDPAA